MIAYQSIISYCTSHCPQDTFVCQLRAQRHSALITSVSSNHRFLFGHIFFFFLFPGLLSKVLWNNCDNLSTTLLQYKWVFPFSGFLALLHLRPLQVLSTFTQVCVVLREMCFANYTLTVCDCEMTIRQEPDGGKKKQYCPVGLTLSWNKSIISLCSCHARYKVLDNAAVPLRLRDICPFTKLADTDMIRPCCQIKVTNGEMTRWHWLGRAREDRIDFPLCLKIWPMHLACGGGGFFLFFIGWCWKTSSGGKVI